jgi:hypothetical protein
MVDVVGLLSCFGPVEQTVSAEVAWMKTRKQELMALP